MCQRLARVFAEERAVFLGEMTKVPETTVERDLLHNARRGFCLPQRAAGAVQSLVPQIEDGAESEHVSKEVFHTAVAETDRGAEIVELA